MCSYTSPTYVYSREIKLKIKVIDEDGEVVQKAKIGVDRDTTSFDRLKNHLVKTLKLESEFSIAYQVTKSGGDGPMAITDDWDLDVALQQSRHTLKLLLRSYTQTITDSTDTQTSNSSANETDNNSRTSSDKVTVTSLLDKIINKMDDLFSSTDARDAVLARDKPPMTFGEFQNYLDDKGRLINYQAFRESIYLGGIAPSMRKVAWRHLLCVFPEGMTGEERIQHLKDKSAEYIDLRDKWKKEYKQNEKELPEPMRFVTTMVKKDVVRADRNTSYYKGREDNKHTMSLFDLLCTYSLSHPDVSYCQGMCDLASPILAVQDNEAHAYLLFCSLMQRMKYNFSFDSTAVSVKFNHLTQLLQHFDSEFYAYLEENQVENLLFSYRWLLLEMKREFPFEDSLFFSEVMWSSLPTLPSKFEISLFHVSDVTEVSSPHSRLSPYAKSSPMDSDCESFVTNSSSAPSDFPDFGTLSRDESLILKQECLERALMEDGESDTVFSIASDSEYGTEYSCDAELGGPEPVCITTLECTCDNHEKRRQSRDSAIPEDDHYSVCGQRQGSNSADSGFGSRPHSPVRDDSTAPQSMSHSLTEEPHHTLPPPKEFGYGNPFLMFAALSMILQQRDMIMEKKMDFNDIVMLFSGYKSHNNVHTIVKEAKQLYEAYINDGLEMDEDEFEHIDLPVEL